MKTVVALASAGWICLISALHLSLNLRVSLFAPAQADTRSDFRLGYIPVTCHLTCPVTDFITKSSQGGSLYKPLRFNGFPELKETFLAGNTEATFILAPLAMSLREAGVKLKIVYLGHRDGTAMMVRKDSAIRRVADLKGRKVAIPNRFSNQFLLLFRALRDSGVNHKDVTIVEMPPPDMPAALYAGAVDAITSGEPYMGQTELDGYGRVLYLTKDIWPNFISCVLAVREDVITNDRATVQMLVDGIARSGKWLDSSPDHRKDAAKFVAENYYHQDPQLLAYVLAKPPDRVKYTNLTLHRNEFEEIERLGRDAGILTGKATFDDYADPSFVTDDSKIEPWAHEAK
jgi:NitT/TauT family transport system substrate-binding protein